ncbi:hypothetical protein KAFR_0F01890 [Kazachstania africana CBS 2517]|uniref:Uncharacterized protein n=1 Tax=Kazachstania africana (strain ATCC 22294 / BCRC 22015 / CBS 2517 / CECT 1963 / NBRC 1671 / NRRL Y-8276) TaxID=1071382 RepID=H2AWN6_KAZAF|nr:hypothetical protein KAFR_0F01890 [Kazachstania africana CBS 2517]CCF58786.1 hypothetical protein KAFR_0F01890 [Kazachstania africana CBS 2517]
MRRAFFHINARLFKSDNKQLRSTLNFLTKGSTLSTTLSELLEPGSNSEKSALKKVKDPEATKHVETILDVLNSTLPKSKLHTSKVQGHYDFLFQQLKVILRNTIKETGSIQSSPSALESLTSEELYNRLILLKLSNKLTISEVCKIVLSKNFKHYDSLWSNITLFDDMEMLQVSLLLYYKTHKMEIYKELKNKWIDNYSTFQASIRRIFWRCALHDNLDINEIIVKLQKWDNKELIILYQSLFEISNRLPILDDLSYNQGLFIRSLRALAVNTIKYKKWMVKIVKLSLKLKLYTEEKTQIDNQLISRYKFASSLNLVLQEVYNMCDDTVLQEELRDIFKMIDQQEQKMKTQISLKFV